MKSEITISTYFDDDLPVDVMVFSGGEVNVTLPEISYVANRFWINAKIADSDGIMALLLTKDALDREITFHKEIVSYIALNLEYVPYSRQDRVCNKGESLAIQVFANLVNSMGFDKVFISDPHSDVTPTLINNVVVADQYEIFFEESDEVDSTKYDAFVAPDAGATKKVMSLINKINNDLGSLEGLEFIQGLKQRDTKTGALSGFDFLGDVQGKRLLIVDDLVDKGGTFIGLTKLLLEEGATTVDLMVTHSILPDGVENLLDNGINHIYTTDSFPHGQSHERITVIEI